MSDADERLGSELRRAADATSPQPVDVDAVLAASRAKRRTLRTRIVGVAASAVLLASAGALAIALQGGGGASSTADAPIGVSDGAPESNTATPLGKANVCGAPVAAPRAGAAPVQVTLAAPGPIEPGASARVLVRVTNDGDTPVSGDVRLTPSTVVADDGITVWHTSGAIDAAVRRLELAPGESTDLPADLQTRRCTAEDESLPELPADAAPLEPGVYEAGAVIEFTPPGRTTELIVSPLVPLVVAD